jgi:cellobiose phosphorylase
MNMVGALQHKFTLKPGQSKEFSVVVGLERSTGQIKSTLSKYRDLQEAKRELNEVKTSWRGTILDRLQVQTPDADLNRMINVWTKYQVCMNNHWGRSATFYHEGGGEFGYRNTAQDAWGMISIDPAYAKERLIKLAEHQKNTGQPMPGWSLATGPSTHRPPSDFPIWLPMLLLAYVKETGDFNILWQEVKFFEGDKASLYEHARRATEFLQDIGKSSRGLPLMGTQDWNDAFDRTGIGGKGESVWLGMGLCAALKNMEELAKFIKDEKVAQDSRQRYEKMKAIINETAWDGDWYCYAFNDYGEPIGSKKSEEGSIQLNAQTWAILAGLPDQNQLKKILKVIDKDLATPYGPLLFTPYYSKYNDRIGRITAFAPGTKENAALFCHGGTFKMAADLRIGRAEEAYQTYKEVLPCSNKDIEIVKSEPYVYPEYYIGKGNERYGEGAFSWLTGSADWAFVTATQWLLGIRPEFEGLLIDPQIPAQWKSYSVTRVFRGATYKISVENPEGVNSGIKEITVDGKRIEGNLIKPHQDGRMHEVHVVLSKKGNVSSRSRFQSELVEVES